MQNKNREVEEVFTRKYRRYVALSEVPVAGKFYVDGNFQLYSPPSDAPITNYLGCTYPFIIEISYQATNQPSKDEHGHHMQPDWAINQKIALDRLTEVLLTITGLSMYRLQFPKPKQNWFYPLGFADAGGIPAPQWGQQGYILPQIGPEIDGFSVLDGPDISLIDAKNYHRAFTLPFGEVLELPDDFSVQIATAESLNPEARNAFLSACSLFDQGLEFWQHHPSLSFASLVTSLETLINYEYRNVNPEKCRTCGQPQYQVTKKFKEFCNKYCPSAIDIKPVLNKIYSLRSDILHKGNLMLGDLIQPKFGTWDNEEERAIHRSLIIICRLCFVNWLRSQRTG